MGYAFISYSTKNMEAADKVRNLFTRHGIDTWMAPYNIPAGSKYAATITRGIRDCSCFVLLLSNDSQASEAVDSEVELATLTFKKTIVTIQLEEVELNDSFFFYIHNKQIIPIENFDEDSYEISQVLSAVSIHTKGEAYSPAVKAEEKTLEAFEAEPAFEEEAEEYDEGYADEEEGFYCFEDENGNEVEYELIDCIEYDEAVFAVFLPTEEEGTSSVLILEMDEEEEDSFYDIEDEELLEELFCIFKERNKDEFNFVDDEEETSKVEPYAVTPSAPRVTSVVQCPGCGATNSADASYCKVCSQRLTEPPRPKPVHEDIPRPPKPHLNFLEPERSQKRVFCPSCGTSVAEGTKYCPCCHTTINKSSESRYSAPSAPSAPKVNQNKICPTCGSSVKATASYCPACGSKLR